MPSSCPYNLTVCDDKKFLWFRVAKVCTRTIFRQLSDNGVRLNAEDAMAVHYPVNRYADYFKFAFVRNPWDRLVSCWHNKIADRGTPKSSGVVRWKLGDAEVSNFASFADYVSTLDIERCDPHLRLQSALIDLNGIDYLGRFESFDFDLAEVFTRIGIRVIPIEPQNPSVSRRPYQHYYTDALRKQVADIYMKDIQIFRYTF